MVLVVEKKGQEKDGGGELAVSGQYGSYGDNRVRESRAGVFAAHLPEPIRHALNHQITDYYEAAAAFLREAAFQLHGRPATCRQMSAGNNGNIEIIFDS